MNKLFFIFTLTLSLPLAAQTKLSYIYDDAGNRKLRTIVVPPPTRSGGLAESEPAIFEETLALKQIKLYPNPVKSTLTVEIAGYENNLTGQIILYDMVGRILYRDYIKATTQYINMASFSRGNYVMKITLMDEQSTWKIIKE